ncbi:Arylsulfatase J [Stylophora pistillata]|uniref:Arylsulfatase J n=3 Tax=Stylophora pistillata TaxID=50429 RepID=A0A2B4RFZ3_STYPI|nr:Arylsulfatase J [Stylophora pistillata]
MTVITVLFPRGYCPDSPSGFLLDSPSTEMLKANAEKKKLRKPPFKRWNSLPSQESHVPPSPSECDSQDSGGDFDFKLDGDDDGFIDDLVQEQSKEENSLEVPSGITELVSAPLLAKEEEAGEIRDPSKDTPKASEPGYKPRDLFDARRDRAHSVSSESPTIERCAMRQRSKSFALKRPNPPRDPSPNLKKRLRQRCMSVIEGSDHPSRLDMTRLGEVPTYLIRRSQSATFEHDLGNLLDASTNKDVVGDFSGPYTLPLIPGQYKDLKYLSPETVARVLDDEFPEVEAHIIDCRYPYEYNAGHIKGARNIYTKEEIESEFIEKPKRSLTGKKTILIFHCEFSSKRGPDMSRFLRNRDRDVHYQVYPKLFYPELYLIEGGYKAFFAKCKAPVVRRMKSDWPGLLRFVLVLLSSHHVFGKKERKKSNWVAPRPHIIMIVADDLGWDDVSFHGSPQIPTPHIDKLANDGVILNSYYVSPICTPTRASLMTGKHPVNLGIQHATIFGTQPYGLPLGVATTPQYLKALGYRTHGVGKWHLGFFEKEYTPPYRGFETYYGFWNGKEDYWDHSSQEDVWGTDLRDNMKPVKNETGHYGTELFSEVAERIIDTHNKSEPLYLYLAQQGVHSANGNEPLQAPERLVNKFQDIVYDDRRTYAGMVASLDESVGNITEALKRNGMFDNSVIVFTTDNGGAPRGFNWNQGCNYPLKGGKDTFWEGGVRGVGFVHSNLIKNKGRVSYDLIDVTDWLPTFYHLAGGDITKINDKIDGMNVWDTIAHGKKSPRTEVLHNIDPIRKFAAIRVGDYKLIINQDAVFNTTWHPRYEVKGGLDSLPQPSTLPGAVIKCGKRPKSKKAACDTNEFPCLFNVRKDPCEYRNLAHIHLPKVRKLLRRLIHYQKNALPVWFPERDRTASPADHDGYWGPWKSSKSNKAILQKVLDSIPSAENAKKHSRHTNSTVTTTRIGKAFSTHEEHNKGVYQMLKSILNITNTGKKVQIPRNRHLMKESLALLYAKMIQKTKEDDLMHKLQMIKKEIIAKIGGVRSKKGEKETLAAKVSPIDKSSVIRKLEITANKPGNVEKQGKRRTELGNIATRDDEIVKSEFDISTTEDRDLRDNDQNLEGMSSLKATSNTKQNNVEEDDLMDNADIDTNDPADGGSDLEEDSSHEHPTIESQTSAKESEMDFQESHRIVDEY